MAEFCINFEIRLVMFKLIIKMDFIKKQMYRSYINRRQEKGQTTIIIQ